MPSEWWRGKWGRWALLAGLLAVGWFGRGIYDAWREAAERVRVADAARDPSSAFEIELFALSEEHPAHSTLCLLDGEYGQLIQDGQRLNRNSHVDFNGYTAGSFTVGIQGGDAGQIVDLGFLADLERDFSGPPLAVMRWRDGALIAEGDEFLVPDPIGQPTVRKRKRRWLETILGVPAPAPGNTAMKAAQVKPGHVYFVRLQSTPTRTKSMEIVALIHVLEHIVGKSVKLRCIQL